MYSRCRSPLSSRTLGTRSITCELKQSLHTTHGHVKEIYRKFNVTSRTALMAIWLSAQA